MVKGDLMAPDSLDAAFEGVSRVFLYTPLHPDAAVMASNAIAAARRAGPVHIVRSSEISPKPVRNLQVGRMHQQTDAELQSSGLPYTILKPTQLMQVMLISAPTVAADGMIYMPYKDGRLSQVDLRDVAEAAALTLTTDGRDGQSYVLTGPASISLHEAAAALSRALGKAVTYVNVPIAAARESMMAMGLNDWLAGVFCEYMENFSNGGGDHTSDDFERLTGHPPRTFATFAQDFAPYFRGAEAG